MANTAGSADNDHSARASKPLSDTEAAEVKGGAISASPASPPHSPIRKPILKPVSPRAMEPCV